MTPRQCGHMWTQWGVDTLSIDIREHIQPSMSGDTMWGEGDFNFKNLRFYWESPINNMKRVVGQAKIDIQKANNFGPIWP